jgi:hypothetical protein
MQPNPVMGTLAQAGLVLGRLWQRLQRQVESLKALEALKAQQWPARLPD